MKILTGLGNRTHDLQITERNGMGKEELAITASSPLSGSKLDPWPDGGGQQDTTRPFQES